MKLAEKGIYPNSEMFFSTPSPMAKEFLYYSITAGHFFCTAFYKVKRNRYDSFLIIYVISGVLKCFNSSHDICCIREGQAAVIDCYRPHEYFCDSDVEFIWLHYDGAESKKLSRKILEGDALKIKTDCSQDFYQKMEKIYHQLASSDLSEPLISTLLYSLLCDFMFYTSEWPIVSSNVKEEIEKAKRFIGNHLGEELSVELIAQSIPMSSSYFSRTFKRFTGFTPYDYVLVMRLDMAKKLLANTGKSIGEIAYQVGFNSEANFIFFFKNKTGFSPLKFRQINF